MTTTLTQSEALDAIKRFNEWQAADKKLNDGK